MSEPYVGEIRIFAGNFAPRGWAFCDGQLLAINHHDTLFSLFGTYYGGDGHTTFGLPDLRGRIPVHHGTGPGLGPYPLGATGGAERVTVSTAQLPRHTHTLRASSAAGSSSDPAGHVLASAPSVTALTATAPDTSLAPAMISPAGDSQPHENRMPSYAIHYIVALVGIYPSRS